MTNHFELSSNSRIIFHYWVFNICGLSFACENGIFQDFFKNYSRTSDQNSITKAAEFSKFLELSSYSCFHFLGGSRFHKRCFKCISCSKKLDSNNVKVSGNKLYCKVCLDKVAPAESPKIYSDTSVIAATDEKGCPRQVSKPYL